MGDTKTVVGALNEHRQQLEEALPGATTGIKGSQACEDHAQFHKDHPTLAAVVDKLNAYIPNGVALAACDNHGAPLTTPGQQSQSSERQK